MRPRAMVWMLAGAAALSSCGDDSSGSTPTPAPTPAPTPSPSPTPTPTPSAPTGITITGEAASPLLGAIQYNEAGGTGTARWATDYAGQFPTTAPRIVPNSIVSAGFSPDYGRAIYRLSATGIDRDSRLLVSATAPAGATVVSPVTSLIDRVGSQAAVRNALQLNSGPYAIPAAVDLTTSSAAGANAGLLRAANIRALLLSQAVYVVGRGPGALDYIPFNLENRDAEIAAYITATPSALLLTQAGAEQLLRATGNSSISGPAYAAMGHLVRIYSDATVAVQTDPAQATRYMLGLQSVFVQWMAQLRADTTAPARILALTPTDIATAVAAFADYPAFTVTGTLFAGPDFDFLAPGASGSRPRWDQSRDGHGQRRTTGYAENDFIFNPNTLAFESVYTRGGLVSVTVPTANAAQISARIGNGSEIVYQALPGFVGTTYFDYVISDGSGQQATARFYIIVS